MTSREKKFDQMRLRPRHRGIENKGNSCWLASCVHTLASIPEFRRRVFSIDIEKRNPKTRLLENFVEQLQLVFHKLVTNRVPEMAVSVEDLREAGYQYTNKQHFKPGEQQDANEHFFRILEMFEHVKYKSDRDPLNSFNITTTENQGKLQKTYQIVLSLESDSMYEALKSLWYPDTWIKELPEVFIFTINRSEENMTKSKKKLAALAEIALDRHMEVNREEADAILSQSNHREIFNKNRDKWSKHAYMLTAAIIHKGERTDEGHYVVYVWDAAGDDNRCVLYDDLIVNNVDRREMQNKATGVADGDCGPESACLLVYTKKKTTLENYERNQEDKVGVIDEVVQSASLKKAIREWEEEMKDAKERRGRGVQSIENRPLPSNGVGNHRKRPFSGEEEYRASKEARIDESYSFNDIDASPSNNSLDMTSSLELNGHRESIEEAAPVEKGDAQEDNDDGVPAPVDLTTRQDALDDFLKEERDENEHMYPEKRGHRWFEEMSVKYAQIVQRMYSKDEQGDSKSIVMRRQHILLGDRLRPPTKPRQPGLTKAALEELEFRKLLSTKPLDECCSIVPKDKLENLKSSNAWSDAIEAIKQIVVWVVNRNDDGDWDRNALFFSLAMDNDLSMGGTALCLIESLQVHPALRPRFIKLLSKREKSICRSMFMLHRYDLFLLVVREHAKILNSWDESFPTKEALMTEMETSRNRKDLIRDIKDVWYGLFIRSFHFIFSCLDLLMKSGNKEKLMKCVGINKEIFCRLAAFSYATTVTRVLQASRTMGRHRAAFKNQLTRFDDPGEAKTLKSEFNWLREVLRTAMHLSSFFESWNNEDLNRVLMMSNTVQDACKNLEVAGIIREVIPRGEKLTNLDWRSDALSALQELKPVPNGKSKYESQAEGMLLEFDEPGQFLRVLFNIDRQIRTGLEKQRQWDTRYILANGQRPQIPP